MSITKKEPRRFWVLKSRLEDRMDVSPKPYPDYYSNYEDFEIVEVVEVLPEPEPPKKKGNVWLHVYYLDKVVTNWITAVEWDLMCFDTESKLTHIKSISLCEFEL